MGNSVRIDVGAKDNASGPIDRIRDKFDGLKKQGATGIITGVAAGASIAAFNAIGSAVRGVTDAIGDSVRGAIEEEASLRRLEVAIGENDKAWDGNLEAVNDVIEARQELGFADDEQRDSLAFLVSVTQDHTKALALQRTAMDLARLKGLDLKTAGDLLGKVYAGNVGILARYGIKLHEGATAQEALAEIQRRSAGQAEAYGDTTAGAMDAASIAVDNLKEDFGTLLMPVIKAGADFLRKDAIPAIREAADAIGEMAEAARRAAKPVADLWQQFWDFVDEAKEEAGPDMTRIFEGGPAAAAGIDTIGTSLDDVAASALAAYPGIKTLFDAIAEGISAEPIPLEDNFAAMFDTMVVEAEEAGHRSIIGYAEGMVAERNKPLDFLADLKEMIKNSLSETAQTTRLLGALASDELAKGLADKDPAVRQKARETRQLILDQLAALGVTPGTLTEQGMEALVKAMNSADPDIAAAAKEIYDTVMTTLPTPEEMSAGGLAAGHAWAAGLSAAKAAAKAAATAMSEDVAEQLIGRSPPPEGPLKDLDVGGYRAGVAWADYFALGLATVRPKLASELGALSAGFRSWEDALTQGGLGAAQDFLNVEAARPTGGHYANPSPGVWEWQADQPAGVAGPSPGWTGDRWLGVDTPADAAAAASYAPPVEVNVNVNVNVSGVLDGTVAELVVRQIDEAQRRLWRGAQYATGVTAAGADVPHSHSLVP